MDKVVRKNLEEHLSGTMDSGEKEKWNKYIAKNPLAAQELQHYEEISAMLQELRSPESKRLQSPDFYSRLCERINEQKRIPFWSVFSLPPFGRRLAFISLMWLAVLGTYFVFTDPADSPSHVVEVILAEAPPPIYEIRVGVNLDENRGSMLASLINTRE